MSDPTQSADAVPDLQEQFREPVGWRWHCFTREGRKIRFGSVFPKDSIPDAVVVCFPGVGEMAEKYFETARDMVEQNYAFWIMDWMGQGKSERYLENHPHRRHGESFDEDIKDMHYFILEYIKHSSVHPDRGRIPLALLAHSMGANIGLRFLAQFPDIFECAAFTSPLIGIKVVAGLPNFVGSLAASVCDVVAGKKYVHGGGDWIIDKHDPTTENALSRDPVRGSIHNAWCEADEDLKVGDVTYGWVKHAHKSCTILQNPATYSQIKTPCFFALAEHEHLVDNVVARKVISNMPKAEYIDIPDACHEILMDKDVVRDHFLEGFHKLVKENILDRPETLKPF